MWQHDRMTRGSPVSSCGTQLMMWQHGIMPCGSYVPVRTGEVVAQQNDMWQYGQVTWQHNGNYVAIRGRVTSVV